MVSSSQTESHQSRQRSRTHMKDARYTIMHAEDFSPSFHFLSSLKTQKDCFILFAEMLLLCFTSSPQKGMVYVFRLSAISSLKVESVLSPDRLACTGT